MTEQQFSRVARRDGRRCRACGTTRDLTLDHIWPRKLGGHTRVQNMQILCGPCNVKKAHTPPAGVPGCMCNPCKADRVASFLGSIDSAVQ